jgi:N-acyl-D-amino-acid deacylase
MGTILLKGGRIIDGTGNKGFEGHVFIHDGKITDIIEKYSGAPEADQVIDVKGCVVCPGFIDMHSHSDWLLPLEENPDLLGCLAEQGITTIVAGNCGFSPATLKQETFWKILHQTPLLERPFDLTWRSMDGFFAKLEEVGPAVNIAELAGHACIRLTAADSLRGKMSPDELKSCLDMLRQSLDEGACGLSFGLGYEPGMYSPIEELEAFCSTAAERQKPVTVHLKALSAISPTYPVTTFEPHNLLALKEMIEIAGKTSIRLQISHFIFVGRRSFWTADKAINMVEQALSRGVDVMFDAFPYMCGNTAITVVLPSWFLKRVPEAYHNPWLRMRLRAELEMGFRLVGFMYNDFQIMDVCIKDMEDLNGLRISDIARKWSMSPFDALLRLCELSSGGTLMLFHAYSGVPGRSEVIERVLSHRLCLFETDALIKSEGYPNPAAMGAFPFICGPLVRDHKLFSLEEAIRRSTSASVERFNITDRGIIKKGKAADIVVFDPSVISDTPPIDNQPAGRPKGIKHVFINGMQVVEEGVLIKDRRAGKVLRL